MKVRAQQNCQMKYFLLKSYFMCKSEYKRRRKLYISCKAEKIMSWTIIAIAKNLWSTYLSQLPVIMDNSLGCSRLGLSKLDILLEEGIPKIGSCYMSITFYQRTYEVPIYHSFMCSVLPNLTVLCYVASPF